MAGGKSGSVFRVGDNVTLPRVLTMVSILVIVIMIFERYLHKLEHHLHKYPKYHEMMTKVFGELMILGLIGLGIKILKELTSLDWYSDSMIAFQAADITIFLVAIALILQATIVFLRMRRKNIQVDKAELISTQHVIDLMARTPLPKWYHRLSSVFAYMRTQDRRKITKADLPEVAQMRIIRHYFLKTYGLPELFPFSKYLRQAQDHQISHMIEVEISMWIMLLLIAWWLDGTAELIHKHWTESYSIVVAFLAFSWLSVLLHGAITSYFSWAIDQVLGAAVNSDNRGTISLRSRYACLDEIAADEKETMHRELAADAISVMESVRGRERTKRNKHKRKHRTHDTGLQLVATMFRSMSKEPKSDIFIDDSKQEEGAKACTPNGTTVPTTPTRGPRIHLRWFSRKAWHFIIMSTLMLNAFYVALYCQCIIYQMRPIYREFGWAVICVIPVPLILNMLVFQPRILRNFILVSSVLRVNDTALGDVIDHFTETVQLRANFVRIVHAYLESSNQTVADIQSEFESRDETKSGFLEAEEVRHVLKRFGFKLSYFKFNSVAKLLFDLDGINIEYAQVLRLLELARTGEVREFANNSMLYSGDTSRDLPFVFTFMSNNTIEFNNQDESTTRSRAPLLRAKSSAAASLYRIDWEEPEEDAEDSPRTNPPSPDVGNYVRFN